MARSESTTWRLVGEGERNELLDAFYRALCAVYINEHDLIEQDVAERDVCAHILSQLEKIKTDYWFGDYSVDVDYNRAQDGRVKAIANHTQIIANNIAPDIVIHGRGRQGNLENLLCVEVKKTARPQEEKDDDRTRLKCLTLPPDEVYGLGAKAAIVCGYQVGLYVEYDAMNDSVLIETYCQGRLENSCRETPASMRRYLRRKAN